MVQHVAQIRGRWYCIWKSRYNQVYAIWELLATESSKSRQWNPQRRRTCAVGSILCELQGKLCLFCARQWILRFCIPHLPWWGQPLPTRKCGRPLCYEAEGWRVSVCFPSPMSMEPWKVNYGPRAKMSYKNWLWSNEPICCASKLGWSNSSLRVPETRLLTPMCPTKTRPGCWGLHISHFLVLQHVCVRYLDNITPFPFLDFKYTPTPNNWFLYEVL
jgi:hypothetical protein